MKIKGHTFNAAEKGVEIMNLLWIGQKIRFHQYAIDD